MEKANPILRSVVIALFLLSSAFVIFGMNTVAAAPSLPDAPTGLAAEPWINQVNLTWTAPAFDGGIPIDHYVVYQDGIALLDDPTGLTATIAVQYVYRDPMNSEPYVWTVAAHNVVGTGPQSDPAAAYPIGVPGLIGYFDVAPGNGQVIITCENPGGRPLDGGSQIDNYIIYQDGVEILRTLETLVTVDGLTNGQSYNFSVAQHNAAGTGPQTSMTVTPMTTPNAPTGLKAIPGNGQVTLNWTAPTIDGGRAADYYVVFQDGAALPYQLTGPSTIITGLVNAQTYSFTVAAHNPAGIGAQSIATVSIPILTPDAPTGLKATPGYTQMYLNWTAPLSNGGSSVDYYIVYQDGVDVQHVTDISVAITGLTYGKTYNFAVSAHNSAGLGPSTPVVAATPNPALTAPGVPNDLTAKPFDGGVELSWPALNNNGGATIDNYTVFQNGIEIMNVTGTSVTITGLTNGRSYSFAIAAHNIAGIGALSNTVNATPYTFPHVLSNLTANPGNTFVTLNWIAPGNNGGSAIDHYVVSQNGVVRSNDTTGLTLVITGLTNGQTYNFTVAAHNLAGVGPYSYIVVTPTQTVPSEPLNLSSSTIDGGIVLEWSAPGDNGGYLAIYQVFRGPTNGSESLLVNTTGNSYTDKAINLGTNYYYFVKAINQLGSSIPSKEIGPIYASAYVLVHIETESSSSIGVLMTVSGNVKTAAGGMPIAGLNIDLSYSANNGQTWIDMPSVKTSPTGNFTSQWIPAATGDYVLKASWAGNAVYQTANSSVSLAVDTSSDKYVFTVQSNSTVSDLSFNSVSKELSFNVSGDFGTFGYSRIVISKQLVANGSDIKVSLDGQEMSYQLNSTDSSWILYFEYHHSTHSIVATLSPASTVGTNGGANDSPLPLLAIAGLAVVTALMLTGLVVFNRRRTRK